jgi:hypothetical protein
VTPQWSLEDGRSLRESEKPLRNAGSGGERRAEALASRDPLLPTETAASITRHPPVSLETQRSAPSMLAGARLQHKSLGTIFCVALGTSEAPAQVESCSASTAGHFRASALRCPAGRSRPLVTYPAIQRLPVPVLPLGNRNCVFRRERRFGLNQKAITPLSLLKLR